MNTNIIAQIDLIRRILGFSYLIILIFVFRFTPEEQILDMLEIRNYKKRTILSIIIFTIINMLLVNVYYINDGEVGILSNYNKISKMEKVGLHLKNPMQSIEKIEIREKTYIFGNDKSNTLDLYTKDIKSIQATLIMKAKIIDPIKVYKIAKKEYEINLIYPKTKEIIQNIIYSYTTEDLIINRNEINKSITQHIQNELLCYGIDVLNISILYKESK